MCRSMRTSSSTVTGSTLGGGTTGLRLARARAPRRCGGGRCRDAGRGSTAAARSLLRCYRGPTVPRCRRDARQQPTDEERGRQSRPVVGVQRPDPEDASHPVESIADRPRRDPQDASRGDHRLARLASHASRVRTSSGPPRAAPSRGPSHRSTPRSASAGSATRARSSATSATSVTRPGPCDRGRHAQRIHGLGIADCQPVERHRSRERRPPRGARPSARSRRHRTARRLATVMPRWPPHPRRAPRRGMVVVPDRGPDAAPAPPPARQHPPVPIRDAPPARGSRWSCRGRRAWPVGQPAWTSAPSATSRQQLLEDRLAHRARDGGEGPLRGSEAIRERGRDVVTGSQQRGPECPQHIRLGVGTIRSA